MMGKTEQFRPISLRLKMVADFVPNGTRVADIGADHAYLLIHLARAGKLEKGIAVEKNQGPYEAAKHHIVMMDVEEKIEARLGDGLSVLQPGEVEVVVIAGMGGALIAQILDEGKEKLTSIHRLILQPNVGGKRVRAWLKDHGFHLVDETLVEDAGILYEVIVAEPGEDKATDRNWPNEFMLEVGPILWQKKHPLLLRKCKEELESHKKVWMQLQKGKSPEAKQKIQEIEEQIKWWEKVILCLSKEKK